MCLDVILPLLFLPWDLYFCEVSELKGFPFQSEFLVTRTVPLVDFVYGLIVLSDLI